MPRLRTLFANRLANRRLQILLLFVIPTALFFFTRAQLSWRPRVLSQMPGLSFMVWSPDGKYVAGIGAHDESYDTIFVCDIKQQKRVCNLIKKTGFDVFLQFSADSRFLYALEGHGRLTLRSWQLPNGLKLPPSPVKIQTVGGFAGHMALSPDCSTLVQNENGLVGRRVSDGKILWTLSNRLSIATLLNFSPDGNKLVFFRQQSALTKGPAIEVWNLNATAKSPRRERVVIVSKDVNQPTSLFVDFHGNIAHLLRNDGSVLSYDLMSGSLKSRLKLSTQPEQVSFITFSPDFSVSAELLIDSSYIIRVQLREWPSGIIRRVLHHKNQNIASDAPVFSPDGDTLATRDNDKALITLWRIK